ncbi:MAG: 1-acyl-sn-glycerol-3-phosphate acyltransferase [Planctomycetaceae bacterium]|jgi:1-acyl-sn-glycerol-3-phosphate acyltransferase|nr:1-acyl-sn-glycerol-3-phosphate acyltransferase [Planctomycetaceae bacterium]
MFWNIDVPNQRDIVTIFAIVLLKTGTNNRTRNTQNQKMKFNLFDKMNQEFLIRLARFLSGATVLWHESQPDTCQRIYFANHTSHLDAVVIWAALPGYVRKLTRMVAAKDYWGAGTIRKYIATKLFNAILIDRENMNIKNTPVKVMIDEIEDKYSMILFPEGGRSETGTLGAFKSGIYHICRKRPDIELIPVYLNNMNGILPRGKTLPVPMLSRIVFGQPMWLEMNESKNNFLERARNAILKLKALEEHYEEDDNGEIDNDNDDEQNEPYELIKIQDNSKSSIHNFIIHKQHEPS